MIVRLPKVIFTPYKLWDEPGTWNLTLVNVRFCTSAEQTSLSTPSKPCNGETLESVDCAHYLGVSISKDLTWNTHIKEILTKANRTLGYVKRNKRTKTNQ